MREVRPSGPDNRSLDPCDGLKVDPAEVVEGQSVTPKWFVRGNSRASARKSGRRQHQSRAFYPSPCDNDS
jgi:hypothetical protein